MKKAFGIKEAYDATGLLKPIYVAGADRTEYRVHRKMWELREAVALKPDVIQVHDRPLEEKDDEDAIVQKLTVNRDMVMQYDQWLKDNRMRERFMLLGVAHGDSPDAYLEEAKFISQYCEVIGIPVGGLTIKRKYNYINDIVRLVAENIRQPIQLMGFGVSKVDEVKEIAKIAKENDGYIWLEGSSIIRESINRRVLCLSPSDQLSYRNINVVKDASGFSAKDCFQYNDRLLRELIAKIQSLV